MNARSESQESLLCRIHAGDYVRVALGVLLIVAAFAKGLSAADSATAVLQGWPPVLQLVVVEAELAFGILLVLGMQRRLTHYVALAVFTVFAVIALRSVASGTASCGCFGAIAVDPRLTLLIDLVAVFALVATRPTGDRIANSSSAGNRTAIGATAAAILVGAPLGFAKLSFAPARGIDAAASAKEFVLLEPEGWVGNELPLLGVLKGTQDLANGQWTLLLHHHGCPDCERVRPSYEDRLSQGEKVLLVETPPFSSVLSPNQLGHTQLPDDREWFVQTPVEIVARDGVVVSVNREFSEAREAHL
ncbi:hypothetical protein Pla108_13900 [Botrimarina colliarenosi]|uniref:Methylamine utilisation protein MauE domain-containing protein n=1 Tax=Botrimarina colliarenosi TaxID=2528001 RepID=A0A5C6AME1_9BACT|nr:DoxX family protein [Botrimarina colliarenosi]TWU00439.1 hypothetical protein Pla108_13900 [Botrimarina colliarenosi]